MPLEQINNEDVLLRRVIYPHPNLIKDDGSVTSMAFGLRKGEDGISVDVERLTTHEKAVIDRSKYRLYGLKAIVPKECGLKCEHKPVDGNYAHALIKGDNPNGDIPKPVSRILASKAIRIL